MDNAFICKVLNDVKFHGTDRWVSINQRRLPEETEDWFFANAGKTPDGWHTQYSMPKSAAERFVKQIIDQAEVKYSANPNGK